MKTVYLHGTDLTLLIVAAWDAYQIVSSSSTSCRIEGISAATGEHATLCYYNDKQIASDDLVAIELALEAQRVADLRVRMGGGSLT